ncbi:MAG: sulfatase-like hydrolase/transferase [Planctomycetes bacterium]|nr:sulfatase-like hydrolase/transferase [Planctomycetota bacterium]
MPSECPSRSQTLAAFTALTYAAVVLHMVQFAVLAPLHGAGAIVFTLVVHLVYAAMFTLVGVIPALVVHWVTPSESRGATWAVRVVAVAFTGLLQLFLFADGELFRRYGNHFNGMIWNLLTTRGGIESMDADRASWVAFWVLVAVLYAVQAGLLVAATRWRWVLDRTAPLARRRGVLVVLIALVVASAAERFTFGLCYGASYRPVTGVATAYPFYQRTRMVSLAKKFGLTPERDEDGIDVGGGAPVHLKYPLAPLARTSGAKDLNVIWLVAESLRWDMYTPEIMPATTKFAAGGHSFSHHYSAGNGTRMGMFGLFYGIYGSYWFPFLSATRSPVVLDAMVDSGYDLQAYTSAKFTFPEFDRTIFSRFPADRMHEGDPEILGWKNDRAQVERMLASIDAVPAGKPFFRFQFFESPHAPYFFPQETVIRPDYVKSVNYVTMDLKDPDQVRRIFNRYVNACRHLDTQLERIYAHLEAKGLLDSTIVIVTGDHGEEFMEVGRWGHHSTFSEHQTRTPFIIRGPGVVPGVTETITSHLDAPAMVLGLLGYTNPPSDYSFGVDPLRGGTRSETIIADWENLCLVDGELKIVLQVNGNGWSGDTVTRADDGKVPDQKASYATRTQRIGQLLKDLGRFGR